MLNRHIYIYFQVLDFFGHSDSRNYSKTKLSIVRVFNWSRYKRKQINIDKTEYEIKDTLLTKYVGLIPTNAKFDDLYEIWWILIVSSIYNINFLYL